MNGKQNNKSSKGKSNYKKGNYSREKQANTSCNDIAWYSKNPKLLAAAGRLSFNNALGLKVSLMPEGETINGQYTAPTIIPGIMRLGCIKTIGISKDGSSDVNNASRQLYSFIRHANSGSRNYEAPDYMTYLFAMGSIYDFYAELVRLYGCTRVYSHTNRYIGKALIESMGYEYEDIVKNLPSLRYYINQLAVKLNSFATPKGFAYFDRGAFISTHVYQDSANDKAGLIYTQYDTFYKWDGTTFETGSACVPVSYKTQNLKDLDYIINFGDALISALMKNEDVGIMSGDTLKAFGKENLRTLGGIDENYSTIPMYNAVILEQIHNTTFINEQDLSNTTNWAIKQGSGDLESILLFDPKLNNYNENVAKGVSLFEPLIDSSNSDPNPDYVMEISRNMSTLHFDESNEELRIHSCGSEVYTTLDIYLYDPITGGVNIVPGLGILAMGIDMANTTANMMFKAATMKGFFDWAPLFYVFGDVYDADQFSAVPLGEIFNYTPVSKQTLSKLHNCALLSLFNISGLGQQV